MATMDIDVTVCIIFPLNELVRNHRGTVCVCVRHDGNSGC